MGFPAGIADKRYLAQLVFHHPLEVTPQIAVDHEDVEDALMVRHKHVALVFLQVLLTFYLDRQQQRPDNHLCPPSSGIVPPEVAVADGGSDAHLYRRKDRDEDQYRQAYDDLVELI